MSDGRRATYVHGKYISSIASSEYIYSGVSVFLTTCCISIRVHVSTTTSSDGGRAKVDERRRASDMYVHSNTAVPVEASTFLSIDYRIYISSLAPVRNSFSSQLVRTFCGGKRATADKRRHTRSCNRYCKVGQKENSRRYTGTKKIFVFLNLTQIEKWHRFLILSLIHI